MLKHWTILPYQYIQAMKMKGCNITHTSYYLMPPSSKFCEHQTDNIMHVTMVA
jgi:hypothetical protein